jgi:diacylglycerol O-acyltransferase / wax synthase
MTEQLSALDATFLELEQADLGAHMHIGAVLIFEPRAGGPPSLGRLQSHLGRRLETMPRYRQRLSEPTTGGLSWPDWEPATDFEIAGHVRRARPPGRGTDADLLEWAGEFFSERLDRTRPLWEVVLVTGLEGGRWALASKTHHCMVDGVGSVDAGLAVLDAEREPEARPEPEWPGDAEPASDGSRGGLGFPGASLVAIPLRAARAGLRMLRGTAATAAHPERAREGAREMLKRSRAMAEVLVRDELIAAPRSSLNTRIGAKRRLAVASVPLDELKAIKRELGGTVNDVVLAVAAGGLRDLLLARGEELPTDGLRAMVPVNLRTAGERLALGNRLTSLFVRLPVAEPDPRQRYARQMDEAETLKSGTQAAGTTGIIDLTSAAPPVIHAVLARSLYATRLFNLTITNVPGPQRPLYAFGSKMLAVWPLVPLAADHAVGLAIFSYDGQVFFCVNADYDAARDLDLLIDGIRDSVAELRRICG